jgi:hypothetical protein
MFSQNVVMDGIDGKYTIRVHGYAVEQLYRKHKGKVNVIIQKPQSAGTEQQNRAMHALLTEYYKSNMHSAPEGTTFDQFKTQMKINYGPVYDLNFKDKTVKVPKSWANYTKEERGRFIDGLISEIIQSGASSISKIHDIIEGMSTAQREGSA